MPRFAFACLYLLPCIHLVYLMVGLLGFILNSWSKPTWFKLFRSTVHSLFTIIHLICAKVQIVDNFSRISPLKWFSHLCDVILQVVFFILKLMCMSPTSIPYLCVHKLRGKLLQVGCLETNTFYKLIMRVVVSLQGK